MWEPARPAPTQGASGAYFFFLGFTTGLPVFTTGGKSREKFGMLEITPYFTAYFASW